MPAANELLVTRGPVSPVRPAIWRYDAALRPYLMQAARHLHGAAAESGLFSFFDRPVHDAPGLWHEGRPCLRS